MKNKMNISDERTILVTPLGNEEVTNDEHQWHPRSGEETQAFLDKLSVSKDSKDNLLQAAQKILGKGIDPSNPQGQETGLVVGYVQSGKTMSFETVTALAHDNGFRMVIVLAGSSKKLLEQSVSRLQSDLQIGNIDRSRKWGMFVNPAAGDSTDIRSILESWDRDDGLPKRTVLAVLLKNHSRIRDLANTLSGIDMSDVPALIIDDEADQASLNTAAKPSRNDGDNEEEDGDGDNDEGSESEQDEKTNRSATYRDLLLLRKALPKHTYLQYTATPQAPLLISIADLLSPNFVRVLDPGTQYVGGQDVFDAQKKFTKTIPPSEIPSKDNVLDSPPPTLLEALRIFVVGLAAGLHIDKGKGNRSMMIHPSRLIKQHGRSHAWVNSIFRRWLTNWALPDHEDDKKILTEEFKGAHKELAKTVGDLPPFEKLSRHLIETALQSTRIKTINAGTAKEKIQWHDNYGWILIGGQVLDRGFTVEGLTVTYMPRGKGVGNVDALYQRARFLGYKKQYLGYCRIFLDNETRNAFSSCVEHERDMRNQLIEFQDTGRPLDEWRRIFILEPSLSPCRRSVIGFDKIARTDFSNSWFEPKVVHENVVQVNREIVDKFVPNFAFVPDQGSPARTPMQRHLVCEDVPLQYALDELVLPFRVPANNDLLHHAGLVRQITHALNETPDLKCVVYQMSAISDQMRTRTVTEENIVTGESTMPGLLAGRSVSDDGATYPGDREIRDQSKVTIQIHNVNFMRERGKRPIPGLRNVPIIAVRLPQGSSGTISFQL